MKFRNRFGNFSRFFLDSLRGFSTFSHVLDNASLQIPEGAVVVIVGRSGGGKFTLLKLFIRLWNVREGSVKLSGAEISNISTANLRDMKSFVTQKTHLSHNSAQSLCGIAYTIFVKR